MKRLLWGIPGSGKIPYFRKILQTRPGNLIGYWPMWESSGSDALDLSPQGNNGVYTAVTLGETGIGDGRASASFDGSAYNDIYSAGLAADFDGAEGTLLIWAKVSDVTAWEDGLTRLAAIIRVDDDNRIQVQKSNVNNQIAWYRNSGGTAKTVTLADQSTTGWMCLALTWSEAADQVKAYMNGAQAGATQSGLAAWTGSLSSTEVVIGAISTVPTNSWGGFLAHGALWNVALTDNEIVNLARV